MAQSYQVTVDVSDSTLQQLYAGGFSLCALKAIMSTCAGQPTFWKVTDKLGEVTTVDWTAAYAAYISQSSGTIVSQVSAPIDYGQVLNVVAGAVTGGGVSDGMSVLNDSTTPYTSGLAAPDGGLDVPLAAFPQFGHTMNAYAPVEQVLLMFTTYPAVPGAQIARTYAESLLVDMAGAAQRTVSYDFNKGWSWGGASWARTIPANTLLAPVLITVTTL